MRSRLALLIAVVLTTAACGGGDDGATTFDESPTAVVITATSGDVSVEADANMTGASVVADTSDEDKVQMSLESGVLDISDDCGDDCSVDYTVTIGGDSDVTVTSTSGAVRLSEVTGTVDVTAGDGNVALLTVTGDLTVAVDDGDILGTRLSSDTASFMAGTGNIDITFDDPLSMLEAVTGEGNITAQLHADQAYAVTTESPGDADIQVDVDDTSPNSVDLRTDDGRITVYRR